MVKGEDMTTKLDAKLDTYREEMLAINVKLQAINVKLQATDVKLQS